MLQRLFLHFVLITLFGLAQIGALTHEISHYADIAAVQPLENSNSTFNASTNSNGVVSKTQFSRLNADQQQQNSPTDQHPICEKCVSYAQLSHLNQTANLLIADCDQTNPFNALYLASTTRTAAQHYQARAPPTLV